MSVSRVGFERSVATALLPEKEEDFAGRDHVDVVFLQPIRRDGAVGLDEGRDGFRAVVGVALGAGGFGEFEER